MKRAAIGFFHDAERILDDYFPTLVTALAAQAERIIVAVDGQLPESARLRLIKAGGETIDVDGGGDSLRGYSQVMTALSASELEAYDEVVFFDHTIFGPLFPLQPLFDGMAQTDCGLWSVTAHRALDWNPYGGSGPIPSYLDPQFIVLRRSVVSSPDFAAFWRSQPTSLDESGRACPWTFSRFFIDRGHHPEACFRLDESASFDPAYFDIGEMLRRDCPILERRLFLTDPTYSDYGGADLPRALRLIDQSSDYDLGLIWQNVLRLGQARALTTNAALLRILPDTPPAEPQPTTAPRLAVCVHVYYVDMLDELLSYAGHVAGHPDLIITTDTDEKKQRIEVMLAGHAEFGSAFVLRMPENRGRDMSSLFIGCRDFFLDDQYDLVCRIHSKRTPQVGLARSNLFRQHLFENLLGSEGFVASLIEMFLKTPHLGLAIPPTFHLSFPTFGHAWYSNRSLAEEVARRLDLSVRFDDGTPIAPYGTMFWFRPKALRKLFLHPWKWSDFNEEPHHVDGGLAHALERIIAYAAQDAGYATFQVSNAHLAEQNYTMLEWKLQTLLAALPYGSFYKAKTVLETWAARSPTSDGPRATSPG
jgi:rhamnosyltransferase